MITVRQAAVEDKASWDTYVKNHKQHTPYHFFAWQQAIEKSYGHQGYYLIAEEISSTSEQSSIVGVLPVTLFSLPFGKKSLCALPFCDIGGILADSDEVLTLLVNASKDFAKQAQAKKIDIRTSNLSQPIDESASGKVRMLMPLPETSEALFNGFKSKLRSQIRKAEKNGLRFVRASDINLLDDFYDVFSHNMRALGSPVHAKSLFIELFKQYKNNMLISVVYHNDIAIGAGIVLKSETKASIPWASTKAEFNRLSPNMMLYWSLLEYLSDNGTTEFDFGRSSFGEGTFKFKQQWGASPSPLTWHTYTLGDDGQFALNGDDDNSNNQPSAPTNQSKLRNIVENFWRKLPVPMTVLLGPKIRKYISL